MSTDEIRIGLIGCGLNMREAHVRRLLKISKARIVAYCDPDPENIARMAQTHPPLQGLPTFADYRDLLDKVRMDGVVISTPHVYHFPQIREALERGLHVLTEKPLVVNSEHARELIRLRDERRRVLLVAYQRHYQGGYRYLRQTVQARKLGRLNLIVGHQSESWLATNRNRWRTDPSISGGGVVADVMSHILEAILWITALEPQEVMAYLDPCGTRVEVIATLVIRFADGVMASVSMNGDTRRAGFREELCLWGTDGSIELVWERGAVVTEWMPEKRAVPAGEFPPESDPDTNFINAVLGLEPVECPAEWGLRVTLLKEAAWESGRTGKNVRVAPV